MSLTRRAFVRQLSAAGMLSLGAWPPRFVCRAARAAEAHAPSASGRVLVLVQLEGGNDGLNTVIPCGDDAYYRARPGIGIARDAVLKLDDFHGLHPQLGGFKQLYDEGLLSIVQGVGYPNPDRSHFRSMDIWHSARPESMRIDAGWLGRALDATSERHEAQAPALALGVERLPLALVAAKINVPLITDLAGYELRLGAGSEAERAARRARLLETVTPLNPEASELEFLRRTALTAYTSAEKLREVVGNYQPAAEYPGHALAQQLKLIAQIVASESDTRIFFVSLGGFDTHSDQAAAHAALLAELSSAVRAFYQDLQGHGLHERVLLATFSEFGRRVKENGSLGTDHGAASQMFVVSAVQGGLRGAHPSLDDLVDGDLKFHTDFRSVYATLLEKWLELPAEPVLGDKFPLLDFIEPRPAKNPHRAATSGEVPVQETGFHNGRSFPLQVRQDVTCFTFSPSHLLTFSPSHLLTFSPSHLLTFSPSHLLTFSYSSLPSMSRILITAGPTRQYLDPVRYLTNASSGRMGLALAEAALDRGHQVVIVSGPVEVSYPAAAEVHPVISTEDMLAACQELFPRVDGVIGVAAPCDYRPERVADHKLAKTGEPLLLRLVETPDVVAALGASKKHQWLVGFALETDDQRLRALAKLERKSCDLMVLNGPQAMHAPDNTVEILDPSGAVIAAYSGPKPDVARQIFAVIETRLIQRSPRTSP